MLLDVIDETMSGYLIMELVITMPVKRHITTVDQKVPVIEMSA